MTRKIANTPVDPTLPKVPVELGGKTYYLCFDLGALAEAEEYFRRAGQEVNLLVSMPELTLSAVRRVFPCALRKFHPDLTWGQAQELLSWENIYRVATAIQQAWNASMPAPEATSPPDPPSA